MYYTLVGKEVSKCSDVMEWAKKLEEMDRTIEKTLFTVDGVGEIGVSTVFLGIDHQYGRGDPLIFETMIFGGQLDQEMDRYSTYDQAMAGHAEMVKRLKTHIISTYSCKYQLEG